MTRVCIVKSKYNFDKKNNFVLNVKKRIITCFFKKYFNNFEFSMIKYTRLGQPYLIFENGEKIYRSFSYSNNYCVIGFSNVCLGIDIETRKNVNKLIKKYFAKQSNFDFLKEWTLREAISKAFGKGIDENFF